jgi:hypothetical protein
MAHVTSASLFEVATGFIDGFIDKDAFKKQIDDWIEVFRKTKPAPGTTGPLILVIRKEKRKPFGAKKEFRF